MNNQAKKRFYRFSDVFYSTAKGETEPNSTPNANFKPNFNPTINPNLSPTLPPTLTLTLTLTSNLTFVAVTGVIPRTHCRGRCFSASTTDAPASNQAISWGT